MFCVGGCLRPVWTEAPRTTPEPVATARREPTHAVEQRELFVTPYDDEDRYQISFEDQVATSADIFLYVSSTEVYGMDCRWQGTTCTGYLPREARRASLVRVRDKYRRCPTFRLMREDVALEIAEPLHYSCTFELRGPR